MRIVRDYQFTPDQDRGASAAIGNFDGVHLGHQAVIAQARQACPDAPLGVVTFSPHPRRYFAPDAPSFQLMTRETRANQLRKIGVERLFDLHFNHALAALSPEEFAQRVITQGLGLRHVVVGRDFQFGKNRAGDAEMLRAFGAAQGFGVTIADLVESPLGEISSTNIRAALSDGRPRDAAEMLGHWHRIEGPVISGEQRGRTLGYPTANMALDGLHVPKHGVYAVLVDILGGAWKGRYHGVASLGTRPMFDGVIPNLETHIFDFAADIYSCPLSVALVAYLRPEARFSDLDALIRQMDTDSADARRILAAL